MLRAREKHVRSESGSVNMENRETDTYLFFGGGGNVFGSYYHTTNLHKFVGFISIPHPSFESTLAYEPTSLPTYLPSYLTIYFFLFGGWWCGSLSI